MTVDRLTDFAERYTSAWCSQDPAQVASFFSPQGSLRVNQGALARGREEIAAVARSFMTAFPDLKVMLERVSQEGPYGFYHWSLTGTNDGPGGSGRSVHIHGFEQWTFGDDGLIIESLGHFDEAEYARQIHGG
ncbi:MAG: ester cyclase [Bryobacterales bacterium]|nr:ester cyclase [Bryobacterales bacterium]